MASVFNDILNACQTTLQAVTFTGLSPDNIRIRMLPKVGETLDVVPCILIAPGDVERKSVQGFENKVNKVYPVEVAIVAAVNRDFSTKLPILLEWRQQSDRALAGPLLTGAPTVWDTRMDYKVLFDRSLLAKQYGYLSFTVRFTSCENRT